MGRKADARSGAHWSAAPSSERSTPTLPFSLRDEAAYGHAINPGLRAAAKETDIVRAFATLKKSSWS